MGPSLAKVYSAKKAVLGERKLKMTQLKQHGELLERDAGEMGRKMMEKNAATLKALAVMREHLRLLLEWREKSRRQVEKIKDEVFEVKSFVTTSVLSNRAFMMTNDPEIREVKNELKSLKAMFLSKNNFPAIPSPPTRLPSFSSSPSSPSSSSTAAATSLQSPSITTSPGPLASSVPEDGVGGE